MPKQAVSIARYFADLPDPRIDRTKKHQLGDILVIALCAVIRGADSWEDEQYVARRSVRDLPTRIDHLNERLSNLSADEATAADHAHDPVTIGKQSWSRGDVPAVPGKRLDALPLSVREPTRVPVGTYRGLRFGMVLHPSFPADVYLEGQTAQRSMLPRGHQGPRAVLNALARLANDYASDIVRVRQDLSVAESQLRDYRDRLGRPFRHDACLTELTGLRDRLRAKLSAGGHEPEDGKEPSTAELADRIKAFKVAHTVEAAPQRTGQKHATAEEPITARIRRRQEEQFASGQTPPADIAPGAATATRTVDDNDHRDGHPLTFRERIERERQANGERAKPVVTGRKLASQPESKLDGRQATPALNPPPAQVNRGEDRRPAASGAFRRGG